MSENCPICKTLLTEKRPSSLKNGYDCPRCGRFLMSDHTEDFLPLFYDREQGKDDEEKTALISHAIRKMQKAENKRNYGPTLDDDSIRAILKQSLPTPSEQKDIFIHWIGNNIKAGGDYVRVNKYSVLAIIGARKLEEFYFIFEHLKTKGIVKNKTVVGGGDSVLMDVTFSYDGWKYYNEIEGGDADKQESFMAMESVPKEQIAEIHDNTGNTTMEWDVFICHASEDKKNFVGPLANALQDADIKVWYDHFELKLGDSLRGKIDEGLANSRYGLVVLSRNFFKKEWPKTELDALASRQNEDGKKAILPIWHGVSKKEVSKFSPILASKLAAKSSDSLESIVIQIEKVLNESSNPQKPDIYKRETAETKKPTPTTSKEKILTDPGAITDKLIWWLGQQCEFVLAQTRYKKPVVWHFSVIDETNKLSPGSAKKRLLEILNSNESPFPAIVENVSPDTIRLKYDFSP